tara:strand:- start:143 stop:1162 length:1020 start_codon:yes stop_codon:yes gene_type:complete
MAGNVPGTKYSTADFLGKFANIAQTSQYRAHWIFPRGFNPGLGSVLQNEGALLCKATSLPGSSIATHDVANDYYGVTQKSAYKRQFDNTIDLTFYIDGHYQILHLFEAWLDYVMPMQGKNLKAGNTFYRANFPESYKASLFIAKFNKDFYGVPATKGGVMGENIEATRKGSGHIEYEFINAFPQNVSSAGVSYDSSSNLEFTVTFAYDRYITNRSKITAPQIPQPTQKSTQPLKNTSKDNPSDPFTANWLKQAGGAAAVFNDVTGRGIPFNTEGLGIEYEGKMINFPVGEPGTKSQAVSGQNVNDSTKQVQDARNGVGSNTSVGNAARRASAKQALDFF